jgi:hypothetical protein
MIVALQLCVVHAASALTTKNDTNQTHIKTTANNFSVLFPTNKNPHAIPIIILNTMSITTPTSLLRPLRSILRRSHHEYRQTHQ